MEKNETTRILNHSQKIDSKWKDKCENKTPTRKYRNKPLWHRSWQFLMMPKTQQQNENYTKMDNIKLKTSAQQEKTYGK